MERLATSVPMISRIGQTYVPTVVKEPEDSRIEVADGVDDYLEYHQVEYPAIYKNIDICISSLVRRYSKPGWIAYDTHGPWRK